MAFCHNIMLIDGSYFYCHICVQGPECVCVHVCMSARSCAGGTEQSHGACTGSLVPTGRLRDPGSSHPLPYDSLPQARHGQFGGSRASDARREC